MVEHRQRVCKLSFERMAARPEILYGQDIGSSYQGQTDTLSRHFKRPSHAGDVTPGTNAERAAVPDHPALFDQPPPG
jgi:hypothetical protein